MSSPDALDLTGCMRCLDRCGLSTGTSGNASLRIANGMRITPSGVPPSGLAEALMIEMRLDGRILRGESRPSSEWRMHAAIYRERPEVGAIVHCHSRHATALACCRRAIPAFHYMVAVAGGNSIRCAPYATFGSVELARRVLDALRERKACLLANHGQLTLGETLESAVALAREVEDLAAKYASALAIGAVIELSDAEMTEVLDRFAHYGRRAVSAKALTGAAGDE